MNIEFHYPAGTIPEGLIERIKHRLAAFHQASPEIGRAEVYFMNEPAAFNGDYGCGIDLSVFGSSLLVRRFAGSYAVAAEEVLEELSERLAERAAQQNGLPDPMYSSVDIT